MLCASLRGIYVWMWFDGVRARLRQYARTPAAARSWQRAASLRRADAKVALRIVRGAGTELEQPRSGIRGRAGHRPVAQRQPGIGGGQHSERGTGVVVAEGDLEEALAETRR